MRRNLTVTALVAALMAGFVLAYVYLSFRSQPAQPAQEMVSASPAPQGGMMSGAPGATVAVPPVKGYLEGQEIRFLHTEASDPQVAQMLTTMMNSPVLVVPSLAQAPRSMLANVYVFTNGMKGDGPFGFQPDVFDSPPGSVGYSPLRAVNLVTWKEERGARELRSVTEVRAAEARDEVKIEKPGAVVNMPLLTWPGGGR